MLPAPILERIVRTAFPRSRVLDIQPLAGGMRNANFKLRLDSTPGCIVLRVYEHDPSICRKEIDLLRLVGGSVPAPEVIHAEPVGSDDLPPFCLMNYVEGISFRELVHRGDAGAIAQAAFSAGEALAAIGRITFARPGWLGHGPEVTAPLLEGADPMPRFVDLCLASPNLARRVPADLCSRVHALVWEQAPRLAALDDDPRLVHGDFNRRNVLVQPVEGRWSVAAVVDWEFAVAGSPLCDIANFLRYERVAQPLAEPHFLNGYRHAGGALPEDWGWLARLADLTAICESLTHDDLPDTVVAELVELVRATVQPRP